mmetsp:Transcript_31034/g.46805  ORF Transcript_31034/g.46805 Transcript_31034/m.46805 type:complete len:84 (+) Transcript_31034:666-917(+)
MYIDKSAPPSPSTPHRTSLSEQDIDIDRRWDGMLDREDLRRNAPSCCTSSLPTVITVDDSCFEPAALEQVKVDDIDSSCFTTL